MKEEKSQGKYVPHDSSTLKKARATKNALRKKAFGKNATEEDRQTFNQAVKTHNHEVINITI